MRMNKTYFMIGLAIALGLFFEFTAYADEADQETIITFSAPVEIPGQALPAGTYLLIMASAGTGKVVLCLPARAAVGEPSLLT